MSWQRVTRDAALRKLLANGAREENNTYAEVSVRSAAHIN